jgi:hypothetical protein
VAEPDRLDYLYREYVRVSDRVNALVDGSFEDFRLLAALGVLLAWPPFVASLNRQDDHALLLLGLLAMLMIVAILLLRDLLKQSIIRYSIDQVRRLEAEIRDALGTPDARIFSGADTWTRWEERWYRPLVLRYAALFVLILLPFPDVVLATRGSASDVAVYSGSFVLVVAVVASAIRVLDASIRAAAVAEES